MPRQNGSSAGYTMKGLYSRFSEKGNPAQHEQQAGQPSSLSGTVSNDLRLIVRESVKLGLRIIAEIDRMLRKINS